MQKLKKIGGKTRAMVVTASIPRCVEYYYAINECLSERHSPYKTIVAFLGEHKYNGVEPALTSATLNGFPDAKISKEFKEDPYRILIVANMFQTGFDEPLLQAMYVDEPLYDIAAVQTLSRLSRAYPSKDEVYVLDFANKTSIIEKAFSKFYRTTIFSGETDPNKLYDLISLMESYQIYDDSDMWICSSAEPSVIGLILFWMHVQQSINSLNSTIRLNSRVLQNLLYALIVS